MCPCSQSRGKQVRTVHIGLLLRSGFQSLPGCSRLGSVLRPGTQCQQQLSEFQHLCSRVLLWARSPRFGWPCLIGNLFVILAWAGRQQRPPLRLGPHGCLSPAGVPLLLIRSSSLTGLLSLCRASTSEQCASALHQCDDRWWGSSDEDDKDVPTIQRFNMANTGSSTARTASTAVSDVFNGSF